MDKNIDKYLKDQNILNIIKTVSGKFSYSIDKDELSSISMVTLWKCLEKYDNTRGAKFTSYLYQQLSYAFKNELKKRKIEYCCDGIEVAFDNTAKQEAFELLQDLPEGTRNILEQRYIYNMTMAEIASLNGYSRETARRRLKKAISTCRERENKTAAF